jgi:NADH:ubiquinone oxidoreductase subunit 6 (subunit J)
VLYCTNNQVNFAVCISACGGHVSIIWHVLLLVGIVICALGAVRSRRLLVSALWLAGCSAMVAVMMYLLGAREVAVIELSVGAGLVTVLFVFAINIAGEEIKVVRSILPRPLAWGLILVGLALLAFLVLPRTALQSAPVLEGSFFQAVWVDRQLDVLLQVVIMFGGILGVLGLLAAGKEEKA